MSIKDGEISGALAAAVTAHHLVFHIIKTNYPLKVEELIMTPLQSSYLSYGHQMV